MLEYILFFQNMVGQIQQYLIGTFCGDKDLATAGHFRFKCESFKINVTALFFKFSSRIVTSSGN